MRTATPAASASSSGYSFHVGSGPAGRWETRRSGVAHVSGVEPGAGRRAASSRLAVLTTCGVER